MGAHVVPAGTRVQRRQGDQFGPGLVGRGQPQVGPQPLRQLGGDLPVPPDQRRRGDLTRHRRGPALDVDVRAGPLAERGRRQHHIGATHRGGVEDVDGDDRPGTLECLSRQAAVGKVRQRIGAQQDEHLYPSRRGGAQDAGGVGAPLGGHRSPRRAITVTGELQRAASRQQAGCQAHIDRPSRATAPQQRQEAGPGERPRQAGRGPRCRCRRLGDRGPTHQHGQRAVRQQGGRSAQVVSGDPGDGRTGGWRQQRLGHQVCVARAHPQRVLRQRREAAGQGSHLHERHAVVGYGPPQT